MLMSYRRLEIRRRRLRVGAIASSRLGEEHFHALRLRLVLRRRVELCPAGALTRATPHLRGIAHRLIDSEAEGVGEAGSRRLPAFPATDRLRPHLVTMLGSGGVRALLGRALALATLEVPWLRGAWVNSQGDLEGLDALGANLDPQAFLEGRIVLLAQLLGLLVVFVGPSLTSRLVGEIWPLVPLAERDFGKEP